MSDTAGYRLRPWAAAWIEQRAWEDQAVAHFSDPPDDCARELCTERARISSDPV